MAKLNVEKINSRINKVISSEKSIEFNSSNGMVRRYPNWQQTGFGYKY